MSRARSVREGENGYTLAFLMVAVTVINVMIAVAMPSWTNFVKRQKEEELIFRGLQYAEAIRVFQKANNRLPISLEELYEKKPRSIRQLYPDPMTENGQWGLLIQSGPQAGQASSGGQAAGARGVGVGVAPAVVAGAAQRNGGTQSAGRQNAGRNNGGRQGGGGVVAVPPPKEGAGNSSFGEPIQRTTGPIVGVYSVADGTAIRKFMNSESYSQWQFKVELLPAPAIVGDASAPRVTSEWIGKPFLEGIEVQRQGAGSRLQQGGLPGQGQELGRGGAGSASSFRPSGAGRKN